MSEQSIVLPCAEQAEVEYRTAPGFPGYRVGSDGTVWSCLTNSGRKTDRWRMLQPSIVRKYKQARLSRDGKACYRKVHHLVLETFVGPRPEGTECCHGPGGKLDNRLENLRWGTKVENYADRHAAGTNNDGVRNGRCVLTERDVLEIRERVGRGENQTAMAREFGVRQTTISAIKLRKLWKYLT